MITMTMWMRAPASSSGHLPIVLKQILYDLSISIKYTEIFNYKCNYTLTAIYIITYIFTLDKNNITVKYKAIVCFHISSLHWNDWATAVSYTHLDVYKRQVYKNAQYIHCNAHQLNLIIEHTASQNKQVKIFFCNLDGFTTFFQDLPSELPYLMK